MKELVNLSEVEKIIGYKFKTKKILQTALTHSSYSNEHRVESNERLEFLGDAVLELTVSRYLFNNYQDMPEGELTKLRASIVCEPTLAICARQIELDKNSYMLIGTLEAYTKIREYFGKEAVVPIYIEVEDGERLQRALNRERAETSPKYDELCRRFLADSEDFSEENLNKAQIDVRFGNRQLEETIEKIKEYINEN